MVHSNFHLLQFLMELIMIILTVRPWTIGKYQSYALAKVWEGTAHLPTQKEQWEDYHSGKYNFRGLFGTAQSEGWSCLLRGGESDWKVTRFGPTICRVAQ
jgi:hypothetical protein